MKMQDNILKWQIIRLATIAFEIVLNDFPATKLKSKIYDLYFKI